MMSSTRAEIGVCGSMIDSLGRTLIGLILFCEVATSSATAPQELCRPLVGPKRVGHQPPHGLSRPS